MIFSEFCDDSFMAFAMLLSIAYPRVAIQFDRCVTVVCDRNRFVFSGNKNLPPGWHWSFILISFCVSVVIRSLVE